MKPYVEMTELLSVESQAGFGAKREGERLLSTAPASTQPSETRHVIMNTF